jgi:hypothetical protein
MIRTLTRLLAIASGSCCPDVNVKQHLRRHCEERSDEAIQSVSAETVWIASLRSQ